MPDSPITVIAVSEVVLPTPERYAFTKYLIQ